MNDLDPVNLPTLDGVPNLDDMTHEPRVQQLREYAVRWLRGFRSAKSRSSNAERLGIPRSWIPAIEKEEPRTDPARRRGRKASGYTGNEWLLWCINNQVPYGAPTADDLNRWLDQLVARGYAQRTQAAMLASLSSFYKHLVREEVIDSNPADKVDRRTRNLQVSKATRTRKPFTFEQMRALLEGAYLLAEPNPNGMRDRAMLEVLAGTGVRADELVQLDLASYYRPSPGAPGTLTAHGKGGHTRAVGVPVEVADAVDDYRASLAGFGTITRTGESGGRVRQPLFVTRDGDRLHTSHVAGMLKRIVDTFTPTTPPRERWKQDMLRSAAGARIAAQLAPLKGNASPHRVRHSYGTNAINAEVPIRQVQKDLGHADVSTTEGYVHDEHQAANSASHHLSPGLHRGWLMPRGTREYARTAERDEIPGQTSVPVSEEEAATGT